MAQTIIVWVIVGLAAAYLGWRFFWPKGRKKPDVPLSRLTRRAPPRDPP
jgi:membrane-associated phospholipid phosphatase